MIIVCSLLDGQNFTQSSRNSYISQPAVTQRLKAIEAAFGVEIFIHKKQLITTTEGSMIEHARDMLKRERLFLIKYKHILVK